MVCYEQRLFSGIPDREGEHAAERLRHARAVPVVESEDALRIAVRAIPVPLGLEPSLNVGMVVHLAVVHDLHGTVVNRHGLLPRLGIHDAQPPMSQADAPTHEDARAIRATMRDHVGHALDRRALNLSTRSRRERNSAYAAHVSFRTLMKTAARAATMK